MPMPGRNDPCPAGAGRSTSTVTAPRIHWLRKKANSLSQHSVLATIALTDTTMTVDVDSEKRSQRIQKEIRKRLGELRKQLGLRNLSP